MVKCKGETSADIKGAIYIITHSPNNKKMIRSIGRHLDAYLEASPWGTLHGWGIPILWLQQARLGTHPCC